MSKPDEAPANDAKFEPNDEIPCRIDARKVSLATRIPDVMRQIEQAFTPVQPAIEARLKKTIADAGSRRAKFIKINEILSEVRALSSKHSACTEGCSACCTQLVEMSQTEADAIGGKIGRAPVQLPADYVLPKVDSFGKQTPCTFLINDRCTIYEHRPFACRNLVNLDTNSLLCGFENWELSKAKDSRFTGIPLLGAAPLVQAYRSLAGQDKIGDIRAFFPPGNK